VGDSEGGQTRGVRKVAMIRKELPENAKQERYHYVALTV
jgi:hypothetical protein